MISAYSNEEFRDKLISLTKEGEPNTIGTPVAFLTINSSGKPFFGRVRDSWFYLTRNSLFLPTPYIISGKYYSEGLATEVSYKIEPMWVVYLWIRILPVFGLIISNFLLLRNPKPVPIEVYIILNAFLGLMMFTLILVANIQKKKMEKDFIARMKIEEEN